MSEIADLAHLAVAKRHLDIEIDAVKALIRVTFDGVTLLTQLLQGTFPNYKQLIPGEGKSRAEFLAPELLLALQRVGGVASRGSSIVRLRWESGAMTVSARADKESVEVGLSGIITEGEPGFIAFNHNYLIQYLKDKQALVSIEMDSRSSPAHFKYRGVSNYILIADAY